MAPERIQCLKPWGKIMVPSYAIVKAFIAAQRFMFCIGSYSVITVTIRSECFPGVQLSDATNKCRLFVLAASPHWEKPVWLRALFWKYIAFV